MINEKRKITYYFIFEHCVMSLQVKSLATKAIRVPIGLVLLAMAVIGELGGATVEAPTVRT